ncbi:MAG: zinc ABC transporter substrate-binding protein [Victivallales bacterium]|nr:zinc ABC transporter substrate-binding protein [Victivallales bacterium]
MQKVIFLLMILFTAVVQSQPLFVMVSIEPQLESVKRIGGELVSVEALVPSGASPETFVPGPRRIAALEKAAFFLTIGVPFEKALVPKIRATFPSLPILDTIDGMEFLPMDDGHSHGEEHGHHHGHLDPHVWLSIANMKVHARAVAKALTEKLPEHVREIIVRRDAYIASLDALDNELRKELEPLRGKPVLVFHPAFGYFLSRYGLRQMVVEVGGREPTGRHLSALIHQAKSAGIRCVFVQPQFNEKTAHAVAKELDGKIIQLNPLPHDYSDGLRQMSRQLLNIGNFP